MRPKIVVAALLIWTVLSVMGLILYTNQLTQQTQIKQFNNGTNQVTSFEMPMFVGVKQNASIMFGHKMAKILEMKQGQVIVEVPSSDFEGIGWNTTVAVKLFSGANIIHLANWTYPATKKPTKIANVGLMWCIKKSEQDIVSAKKYFRFLN